MNVKEESEKASFKFNIQKTKIMAYSPITSWQIDGETMETVTDFTFLSSKIMVGGDGSLEIKRCLRLRKIAMTSLDSVKKQRYHFPGKGPYSQSYGFSSSHVQMWELSAGELMLSNCGTGEDSWESLGQQGDQTSHF